MKNEVNGKLGRRGFLQGVAAATGAVSLTPTLPAAVGVAGIGAMTGSVEAHAAESPAAESARNLPLPEAGYQSLGPDEVAFVEALVNVMCPADGLTPNGVDCGLAVYIDRQLAGGFGKGERLYSHGPWKPGKPQHGYQLPLTPEQFFKAGLAQANSVASRKSDRSFAELTPDEANAILRDIAGDKIEDTQLDLAAWFNELVYPLFVQACFADPIYGGNVGKVFWKMIGYPGLPATHAEDMVQFRGKPYPGAREPKAITDFS